MSHSRLDDRLAKLRVDYPPSYAHGLGGFQTLLSTLNNPHLNLPPVFHVAGTNGKGSVLAYIQSIFETAGLSVHKYISPHLMDFNERIILNGHPIATDDLMTFIDRVDDAARGLSVSFFEIITAVAFVAFSKTPADVVLLETGLGGLHDATNVVPNPLVSIITKISYDHTHVLGDTLAEITTQKAGIIKDKTPVILAPQMSAEVVDVVRAYIQDHPFVVMDMADVIMTQGYFDYDGMRLPLPDLKGAHQIENAITAIAAIKQTKFAYIVTPDHLSNAMKKVTWPGRLQQLTSGHLVDIVPHGWEIWVDGAHNDSGAKACADFVRTWGDDKPVHLLTAFKAKKDIEFFFASMVDVADTIWWVDFPIDVPMMDFSDVQDVLLNTYDVKPISSKGIMETVKTCTFQFDTPCRIMMTGSLYFVGHALKVNQK